jgi:hypothetical protein
MIVIGELGLELQERTRESHSVVLLGTSECALAMSHPVTGRSEPDKQRMPYPPERLAITRSKRHARITRLALRKIKFSVTCNDSSMIFQERAMSACCVSHD